MASRSPSRRRAKSPKGRRKAAPASGAPAPAPAVPAVNELAAVFRRLDASGDGALSIADVDRAVGALHGAESHGAADRPALRRAFHAADASGAGSLGLAEFCLFFEYLAFFKRHWPTFEEIERVCADGKIVILSRFACCPSR